MVKLDFVLKMANGEIGFFFTCHLCDVQNKSVFLNSRTSGPLNYSRDWRTSDMKEAFVLH